MTGAVGPTDAAEVVNQLEDKLVDVDAAAQKVEEDTSEDTVGGVPEVPEPPD